MKWVVAQAGQITGEWLSLAPSGASSSQCCTFIPVWGHLNTIGWAMASNMPVAAAPENYGCLRRYRRKPLHCTWVRVVLAP